jgi:hypothetical protein
MASAWLALGLFLSGWDALEKVRAAGAKTQFERFPHPKKPVRPYPTIPDLDQAADMRCR